ncbi:cytochrome ubiquinol oxidase subunit I [Desulfobaculum bizertense]|uniref:Cytochrome bd-I ubiquinol oxidase subunit 1 apoprotein n=1 Tax=Desulfobaculum bizertense DSM 18034 TaxID=1121442 RepID=A0A1T4WRQ5_9BACT|nr:cytochrome ubiquinol oxidase subunit I [Desulfobaculum bizertense]SKA80006.1 cytochrome bd-I ubiquinol oxidase subunit 1 apoprotein [Desulfobaculum bizertense DSM 18034]
MDALFLSRLQFAAASMFHFIFVPLTLGLSILVAVMETKYLRSGDETYKRMAKFWGKLFLINFALGVVTGITLEFQFGTNWSRYSEYVGDIFGSLLAIEATVAFFLESTFIAVWVFGWERINPKLHCASIWIVAIASNISGLWILLANGFMQNPVGYVLRNGRAELASFTDVVTNPFGWLQFFHVIPAAIIVAAFFVMGISAWHLLRKSDDNFFTKSFRMGATWGLIFSIFVLAEGHVHGNDVAKLQPAKLAAMEAHWETTDNAPMYLLQIPDPENERNLVQALPIPGLLSFLAFNDPSATVQGLKDFPKEDRPPVMLTFISFRAMVGLGSLFIGLSFLAWLLRNRITNYPLLLKVLVWSIPLPYLGHQFGWIVAEVGRQPWIVYNLMRTSDAVSAITTSQVGISLAALVGIYLLLGAADIFLLFKYARKVPE